jgi:UDP-N-acetyl-D-glucosamine dehydrogenase
MKRVGVIGQGYVGLAVATAAADVGHTVTGYDTNSDLVQRLGKGNSHIEDVDNNKLKKLIDTGKYFPTNNPSDLSSCEIIIIAVPTPLNSKRQPDLTYLESAVDTLIEFVKNEILIISESTSYPGTIRKVIAEKILKGTGISHRYAAAPERIDPGNKKWFVKNTPRVVAGLTQESGKEAQEFYLTFTDTVNLAPNPEVAEMAKLVENSFRYINIAFVNELAQIAKEFEISINDVLDAAATKPYGYMRFNPGAGVGGHCIPIDPIYLSTESEKIGIKSTLIERSDQINLTMPSYVISRVLKDNSQDISGKKVLVVGVSYKPDIADIRETPAVEILRLLQEYGAISTWHDPLVPIFNGQISSIIESQDIAIILNLHKEVDVIKLKKIKYVFDCTGKLKWAKGF